MPTVRHAKDEELATVGRVLARAFVGDPIWTWMAPPGSWGHSIALWFEAEVRHRVAAGAEIFVDEDVRGAALWARPGAWSDTFGYNLQMAGPSLRAFRGRLRRAFVLGAALAKVHPREPHWYLGYLGTDPAHQGSGVGSTLISGVTDLCDEQGLPAYLESSKESNLAFYARHGFEARDPLTPGGSPEIWPMWREPRT